jgi:cytoskeletal protein CcmA (bactofilin family)
MFQKIINNEEATPEKAPHTPNRPQAPQASQSASAPASATAPSSQPQAAGGHRNRLSSDVEIKGNIRFQDELIVDGKVDGEITSTGALAIQENARIRAEIKVGSVVIQGKVHGNITASQHIELRAGSEVVGDIKAAVLTMEAGAIFVGRSEVGAPTSQPASKPAGNNKPQQGGSKSPQSNGQPKKEVAKAS